MNYMHYIEIISWERDKVNRKYQVNPAGLLHYTIFCLFLQGRMKFTGRQFTKNGRKLDKRNISQYNKTAKLIEYCKSGIIFFMGEVYLFSACPKLNLIKCKFRFLWVCEIILFAKISLATIGVCVFVRLLR